MRRQSFFFGLVVILACHAVPAGVSEKLRSVGLVNSAGQSPDGLPLGDPPPQYRIVIKDNPAEMRFDLTLISSDNRALCVSVGGWPDGLGHVDWTSSWVKLDSKSRVFPARDWNFGYCEGKDCSHRVGAKSTLAGFIGYAEFDDPKEIAALPDRRLLFETSAYVCPHEKVETDTPETQPKQTQALLDADWSRSTTKVNAASTTPEEREVSKNAEMKSLTSLRTVAVSSSTTESAMAHENTVMQLLSDGPGPLQRKLANVPSCVLRGLRHWYEKPFVFVEMGQSFPEIRDIRRAGDGRFRLLFFAELKNGNSVLSFEDHTSLGITHRAVIFRRDRGQCSVVTDFAFDLPLNSLDQLRVAIDTQKNERSE